MATLLKTSEAAARLRRPVETLRYWRWRGEGPPSFKIGRTVVYDSDALEDWIDAQRLQSRKAHRPHCAEDDHKTPMQHSALTKARRARKAARKVTPA